MPPPQRRWRRALSGLLIATLLTYAFLTLVGNVIVKSWPRDPSCMWTRICVTVFFCGMSAWCFVTVVSRPSFYVHDALVNPMSVTVKRSNGGPRWCSKCAAPKPDRCHHCRQCHRCITRMDHHCPWLMETCIGQRNYKAFVLFLLYTTLLCVLSVETIVRACLRNWPLVPGAEFELPTAWILLLGIGFLVRISVDAVVFLRSLPWSWGLFCYSTSI